MICIDRVMQRVGEMLHLNNWILIWAFFLTKICINFLLLVLRMK